LSIAEEVVAMEIAELPSAKQCTTAFADIEVLAVHALLAVEGGFFG
jgi:hypothetical protein